MRILAMNCSLGGASLLLALLGILSSAAAQPATAPQRSLAERLQRVETQLEQAAKSAAQAESALELLAGLQEQLTGLAQEMGQQRDALRGRAEAQAALAELQQRLDRLELQLAAVKLQLGGKGQIAGLDQGFFLKSLDGRFRLRLGGLLQAAYIGRAYQESRLYSDGELGEQLSTFQLHRARLIASGHLFSPRIGFQAMLGGGAADPATVLDAYAELRAHRALNLQVGKMKVPLGRQFMMAANVLQFAQRSPALLAFIHGWDLGAQLSGQLPVPGSLRYQLGLFNGGTGAGGLDQNLDFLYAARLVYGPFGAITEAEGDHERSDLKVEVGAAFSYNLARTDAAARLGINDPQRAAVVEDVDGDGDVDNVGIYTVGAELTAFWRGLSWQNELFYRREQPGAYGPEREYLGLYSQLGYFALPQRLEVAARYGYLEPNHYGADRTQLLAAKVHEASGVVSWMVWQRLVKGQLEFTQRWLRQLQGVGRTLEEDASYSEVRLQLQLSF